MTAILFIALLIWFGFLLLTILSQVFLWQRKEYRWDRMRSYLKSPEFFSMRHVPLLIAFLCGIASLVLVHTISIRYLYVMTGLSSISLLFFGGFHVIRIVSQGIFRPQFTLKAILISGLAILLNLFTIAHLILLPIYPLITAAVIPFVLTPIMTALAVFLINIPAFLVKKSMIARAKKLRAPLSTQVVGITGSYGKTSTKHFLLQILSNAGKQVKATKEHRNSEIGVALDILEQLTPSTDIYIAEMGAYKKGEIAAITDIAKPSIGIVTAIGNQHLDIFSSQQALAEAKKELVNALPSNGVAILNADDPLLQTWSNLPLSKTLWFSVKGTTADIYASHIVVLPEEISCDLHIELEVFSVRIPLASTGLLSSVLAAVAGAHALGMNAQDIAKALTMLKSFPQTMEVLHGVSGSTILDDSYSGGYHAALNALEHFNQFPQSDKRIVFVPIIELGKDAEKVHEHIGTLLAQSNAAVYIYGKQYKTSLQKGLQDTSSVTWIEQPKQLIHEVTKNLSSNTAILLEGRVPNSLRQELFRV